MQIRRANEVDLEAMWGIFQAVVVTGDTLPFSDATDKEVFRAHWFGVGQSTFVAKVDSRIFGMYTLGANYPDLGSHVASATYLVSPEAQGLVITQYFRDSRLLLFALEGRWILAGGATTGSVRPILRAPAGARDVNEFDEIVQDRATVPRPCRGAKAIMTGFPVAGATG